MKKLMKLMVVAAIALSPFMIGVPASAQQAGFTCEVGFTGPDSQNMCTSTTSYSCEVTNTNTVTITNQTTQEATSGTVTVSGNTTGGSGSSGTVTNDSGTTFSVVITNPSPQSEEPGVCTAALVVPASEPPVTVVPTSGGGGEGAVEVLPETSGDTTLQTTGLIAAALLLTAGVSVGGVLWYRHHKAL